MKELFKLKIFRLNKFDYKISYFERFKKLSNFYFIYYNNFSGKLFYYRFDIYFRQDKILLNLFEYLYIIVFTLSIHFFNNDFFNFNMNFLASIEIVIINIVFNKIINEH